MPLASCSFPSLAERRWEKVGTLHNQTRILSAVRYALSLFAFYMSEMGAQIETMAELKHLDEVTADGKTFLDTLRIPHKIASCGKNAVKAYKAAVKDDFDIFEFVASAAATLEKGLSVVGKTFYKPVALVERHVHLGEFSSTVGTQWEVLSVVMHAAKAVKLTAKIAQGKHVARRILALFLVLGALTLLVLALMKIYVHPSIYLSFAFIKCSYGLWKVWASTAP